MVNIGFWSNQLCERGTEIALYDYAYYNEKILNNKSYIFYEKNNINNNTDVINKFSKYFTTIGVNYFCEIDDYLLKNNINIILIIKTGHNDNKVSKIAKNVILCIFNCNEEHGDAYIVISDFLLKKYNKQYNILPHIVYLPNHQEDMRIELKIPQNALVYGRHGGYEQFDIKYVQECVYNVALNNPNIYFIFVNTKIFCNKLENIIFLNKIIDLNDKRKFINTCDAMLWGRSDGETFGLSIAEFSICNKPVLATKIGDLAHVDLLNNKGIWYSNKENLEYLLVNIDRNKIKNNDWNAYKNYTPEKVMKIFSQLAIEPFI